MLVTKITTFHTKHGPFDACVIVGDLFKEGSDGSEIDGVKCACESAAELFLSMTVEQADRITVPIPTYFSVGKYALPGSVQQKISESGGEVTDNLVYLGKLHGSRETERHLISQAVLVCYPLLKA